MLTFFHPSSERYCDGLSRRGFLRVGGLALGGLAWPDLLRMNSAGAVSPKARGKSVIMICLGGGPSHLEMYDMKPEASAEVRGEFRPISSNVAGMPMCELLPQQAKIADKIAVVRSATWQEPDHQRIEIFTGYPKRERRPSFGSYVSRFVQSQDKTLPTFVSLKGDDQEIAEAEQPLWVGPRHRAFVPDRRGLRTLELKPGDLSRLQDRKELLAHMDGLRREVDAQGEMGAYDEFTGQAVDMLTSGRARRAFDLSEEKPETLERYRRSGDKFLYSHSPKSPAHWDWEAFVRARRLVEAGVPFVSLQVGLWDHHCDQGLPTLFDSYRTLLPVYDNCLTALITDLHERGLHEDVCVVVWGEFGRTPRINQFGGRDHWPAAGSVLFSGGGLKMGQYVGATDANGERPSTRAYTPQNILATLYHVLGIDPAATLSDHSGRPQYLLTDRDPVHELI